MLRCVRAKLSCRCAAHETPVSLAALGLQHVRVGLKVLFLQEAHFAIRFRVLNRFVEGFQTHPESRRQLPESQEGYIE